MKRTCRLLSAILAYSILLGIVSIGQSHVAADSAPESTEFSRRAATEGMVLLKNDNNALSIIKGGTVSMFGKGQKNFVKGGGGSGDVNVEYTHNLIYGMKEKNESGRISLNMILVNRYDADSNYMPTEAEVEAAAAVSDTAVVVISRYSEESVDRSASVGDYYLSADETNLLYRIQASDFKHVVIVFNVGGMIDTSFVKNYPCIDGILMAWQPGMEGGCAAADILCGDANPSGKLTDTFAKNYSDYPSSATFNPSDYGKTMTIDYYEDIYVGYRYFETFDPGYSKVNYPFGFGLSYTTFTIGKVKTSVEGGQIKVTADVKNTGRMSGREVVQVYFSAPNGLLGKPAKELSAFAKTKLLEPGESETLTMAYNISDMASYDDTGKTGKKSAYVLEAGSYRIYVGNSVKDAGEKGVRYTYDVDSLTVTEQLTAQAGPIELDKRLVNDGSAAGTYEALERYQNMDDTLLHRVSASGKSKIEAEYYLKKHANAITQFNEDSSVCAMHRGIWEHNSKKWFMTYVVDVEAAGIYSLSLRYASEKGEYRNSLKIYLDDTAVPAFNSTLPNTGGYWEFADTEGVAVNLPAGTP